MWHFSLYWCTCDSIPWSWTWYYVIMMSCLVFVQYPIGKNNDCFFRPAVTILGTHRSPDIVHGWPRRRPLLQCTKIRKYMLSYYVAVATCVADTVSRMSNRCKIRKWSLNHAFSQNTEMSCDNRPHEFERVIVARTLATWLAIDWSIAVQIANPSSESLALHD